MLKKKKNLFACWLFFICYTKWSYKLSPHEDIMYSCEAAGTVECLCLPYRFIQSSFLQSSNNFSWTGNRKWFESFTDCNSLFPWKQTTETHIIPPQHRCLWNKACELVQAVISRLLLLSYNIILCYISKQEDQTSKTTEWKSESLGVGKQFRYCSLQHHVPVRRHKYRNRSSTQTSHVVDGATASQMTSLFSTLTPNAWWNTSSVLSIISQSWSETIFSYFNMNNIFWDTDFNTKGTLLV